MVTNGLFDELLNEFGVLAQEMELEAILGFILTMMSATFGLTILLYVLESIGLYTLCSRRGLGNAWLAWIPVGNLWTLGKIADQDQEKRSGKPARLRVWMMVLLLAVPVAMILMFVVGFVMGSFTALSENSGAGGTVALGFILMMVFCYLLVVGIAIALQVLTYVAYYRLFRSCRSDLAPVFLVLGIFFSFLLPIFVFAVRKRDDLPSPQPVVEPVE